MLVLKDICWRVPEKEILDSVSLTVPDGKCVVVTGPNGGGKTSLAKIIEMCIRDSPDSGRILWRYRLIHASLVNRCSPLFPREINRRLLQTAVDSCYN